MNFRTLLLLSGMVGLPCTSYALEGDYKKLKEYKSNGWGAPAVVYQGNLSGKCYFRDFNGHRAMLSEVDCNDHGISVLKDKTSAENKDPLSELLLEYLWKFCTKDDFPMIEGETYVDALRGEVVECRIPKNFDKDAIERRHYELLKQKYEGD